MKLQKVIPALITAAFLCNVALLASVFYSESTFADPIPLSADCTIATPHPENYSQKNIYTTIAVGWNFNPPVSHHLEKVVVVEGMDKMKKGFCNSLRHNSHKREQGCNKLTKENCQSSDCCVFLNGKKCVAGNAHGPVYRSDDKGNKIDVDNYYFKSKCYGKC